MQFGINAKFTDSKTNTTENKRTNVNFDHLTFELPVTPWWAGSFGLLPYAAKGYNINVTEGSGLLMSSSGFSGIGTLTKVYLGNAIRLGKHLSLGINTWFLFGKVSDNTYIYFPYDSEAYDYMKNSSLNSHGFGITNGLQYQVSSKNGNSFTFGATFEPKVNIKSKFEVT
jgi:hypothetical protein